VDGGRNHTVALKTDGTVWTWGLNDSGQLGDGTTVTRSSTPVKVVFPNDTTAPKVTSTVPSANATGGAPTVNPLDQNPSPSGSQRKDWTFKLRPQRAL
jgi:Regulator of chromosome condensation (RCC1) repeat